MSGGASEDAAPTPARRFTTVAIAGLLLITAGTAFTPLLMRLSNVQGASVLSVRDPVGSGPEVREAFLTYQEAIAPHQLLDLGQQSSAAPHSK